jgi:hypothetical protein
VHVLPASHAATPQHTPSVQKPLPHLVASMHESPRPREGTQIPVSQTKPAAQSSFDVHTDLQLSVEHAYAPHERGTSLHLPEPSQMLACVSMPEAQLFPLHTVPPGG